MPMEKSQPDPKEGPASKQKDIGPYWSAFTAAISSQVWLPVLADPKSPNLKSSKGMPGATATGSWFHSAWTNAPDGESQNLFPTDFTLATEFTESAATPTQARKIRVYPTKDQRRILKLWFDAARWCFNETAARLKADSKLKASWKGTEDRHHQHRTRTPQGGTLPGQEHRRPRRLPGNVRGQAPEQGTGTGDSRPKSTTNSRFRSRKAPKQGCYIPKSAVTGFGAYYTILGNLRMTEGLPDDHGDSRLTLHNGQYHLAISMPAERRLGETQARAVALDPGIRNFLTWFSEYRHRPHRPRSLRQNPTTLQPPR